MEEVHSPIYCLSPKHCPTRKRSNAGPVLGMDILSSQEDPDTSDKEMVKAEACVLLS